MWWIYWKLFRSFVNPIRGDAAKKWRRRMPFLYMFAALNFAGYMWNYSGNNRNVEEVSVEERYKQIAKKFRMQKMTAYRYKNGSIEKYEIDRFGEQCNKINSQM